MASEDQSNLFGVTVNNSLTRKEAQGLVEQGKYDTLVFVPRDFNLSSEGGKLKVLVDPAKSQQLGGAVLEGIRGVVARLQGGATPVEASEPYGDLRYIDFLAPAIIVMTIFFRAGQGTGRALAGEKREGTLDRLAMTPASANDIVAGKTTYAVSVQLIRAFIIILAISFIFNVAMNGS